MSHYIFVLNCGSSSLKFSVINPENGEEPLKGLAERLGVGGVGNITIKTAAGGKTEQQLDPGTHQEALHVIVAALKKEGYRVSVDGALGPGTMKALEAYQRKHNLGVGGVTRETLQSMGIEQ